ncbi:MAG TPA: tannase/feruloyl esterase family alpha/beta hydrolase [Vicinamibacterales bacterium]|nr:tannase/feruloyl esterase family alpha/beta hydrolase [Vicinamibacterales bacterium]
MISLAVSVPAGDFTPPTPFTGGNAPPSGASFKDLPAFCRVAATLTPSADSDIKVEIWMPVSGWNGKFMGVGNGGWAGSISYGQLRDPLRRGYAVASTDTGHSGGGLEGRFALGHPEKLIDFGYRAVHEMTVMAKAVVRAFYGPAPRFSYWVGGSTGGKQGLTEAQRFPDDYDGIIAGAPVNYWGRVMSHLMWIARATHDDPAAFVPPDKYPAIHKAVLDACDALDGLRDSLVSDPARCSFDPNVLLCSGGEGPSCLTAPQVQAVKKIYGQAADPRTGRVISPGLLPGSEIAWHPSAGGTGPFPIVDGYFKYVVFKNPEWDYRTLDFDRDVRLADQIADNGLNATDPDLGKFERHGGKLLLFHGWSDELISPLNTVEYYESVMKKMGAGRTDAFARLFMAPGMRHGIGVGPGPNTFDMIAALEEWVEKGAAPSRIVASHTKDGKVDRTRPLCSYPQQAVYNGSGDSDDAANFTCKARQP